MITYRIAKETDMPEIATVHQRCFPGYFISSLGESLIAAYYVEFLKEESLFWIALDDDKVIGFCMGYLRGKSAARDQFIKNNRYALMKRISILLLSFDKLTIKKCMNFVAGKFKKTKIEFVSPAKGDLLSIGVLPEYRGKGVSKQLVMSFEESLRLVGANDYLLSVYTSNSGAIHFYEKCGMKKVYQTETETKYYKELENA